jgi:hypothetical protein
MIFYTQELKDRVNGTDKEKFTKHINQDVKKKAEEKGDNEGYHLIVVNGRRKNAYGAIDGTEKEKTYIGTESAPEINIAGRGAQLKYRIIIYYGG